MSTDDRCPDCGDPKEDHSDLVGCLAEDDGPCPCERKFPSANATPEKAEAEKAEAMGRAEQGTDPSWEQAATDAALYCARDGRLPKFTADDVWARLEHLQVPAPREPRALGPVLTRLRKAGRITMDGYLPSRRRHSSPVAAYVAGPDL